jgi:hypothetical protein
LHHNEWVLGFSTVALADFVEHRLWLLRRVRGAAILSTATIRRGAAVGIVI